LCTRCNRQVDLEHPADQDGQGSRDALVWDNGATGKVNDTRKGPVHPEQDPENKRFTVADVDAYSGTRQHIWVC
jgi:hypothetical protein